MKLTFEWYHEWMELQISLGYGSEHVKERARMKGFYLIED